MSNLDVSLDDLIKRNKSSTSRNPRPRTSGSGSGTGFGPGPRRRFPNRAANRPGPYSVHAPESTWDHDMFAEHAPSSTRGAGVSGIETGIKLLISNLDYGVSNEDIKELFSEAGDIKRYSIHYDKSGRSKGTAEVIYSRRRDAEAAFKRYNNVQLDGKPMKIEFVGTNVAPPSLPPIRNRLYGNPNPAPRRFPNSLPRIFASIASIPPYSQDKVDSFSNLYVDRSVYKKIRESPSVNKEVVDLDVLEVVAEEA